MKDYVISDNFLPENDFLILKETLCSDNFPWYIATILTPEYFDQDDNLNFQLVHNFFFNNRQNSSYYQLLYPLIDKLNCRSIVKIKANLTPKTESILTYKFHTDVDYECMTSVFYLNTNDGFTKFLDGTIVNSVENRLLTFNSLMRHTGSTCTDEKYRSVININYF